MDIAIVIFHSEPESEFLKTIRAIDFNEKNVCTTTVKPVNSKLFEKQQKVYYCQEFTIEKVIYVIN